MCEMSETHFVCDIEFCWKRPETFLNNRKDIRNFSINEDYDRLWIQA